LHNSVIARETGKKRSRRNALKHGFFSKEALAQGESQAEFNSLFRQFRRHFKPIVSFEKRLVEKLAIMTWRQRKISTVGGQPVSIKELRRARSRIGLEMLKQSCKQGQDAETIIKQKIVPLLRATKRLRFRSKGKVQVIEVPDHRARLRGIQIVMRLHGLCDENRA
jgi:hypothetical protein